MNYQSYHKHLKYLYCGNDNLTKLPKLPQTLKILCCRYNKLNELPELPQILIELYCYNNNIKYLLYKNCQIIKKLKKYNLLNNPFSANFTTITEFISSLE